MRYLFIFYIVFFSVELFAQPFTAYPEDMMARNTMIPSLADYLESPQNKELMLSAFVKQRTGHFKSVRDAIISGQYSTDNSNIGVFIASDRKGDFLHRNRASINYANHINIAKGKYLSGGISVGIANYSIISNSGGPSASDFDADASIGIAYYDNMNTVNITFNQIPKSKLGAFYQALEMNRFLQALVLRNFQVSEMWEAYIYGRIDIFANNHKQYSIGGKTSFGNVISLGMSINTDGAYFTSLGLKYESEKQKVTELFVGYQIQTSLVETRINNPSVHIGLIFFTNK